jgi:hypothetical protein
MNTTSTIMNDGIHCLIEKLGVVETEIFISQLIREPFDYTQWQREQYADVSVADMNKKAVEYALNNPRKVRESMPSEKNKSKELK